MVRINYKIGKRRYKASIPTAYNEITIGQLIDLMAYLEEGKEDISILPVLTGIPLDHFDLFPDELISEIEGYLALILTNGITQPEFLSWQPFSGDTGNKYYHIPDYGQMIIGQFEDFKRFTLGMSVYKSIPFIMAFLTSSNQLPEYDYTKRMELIPEIEKLPASIGMAFLNDYLIKEEILQKRFVFLGEQDDHDPLLEEAGIDTLSKFGFYNNAEMLAGGNIFEIEKIMTTLTVNQVYYHLTFLKLKARVQKNYSELKEKSLKNGTV